MQVAPKTTQLQGWGIAVLRVVTGYLFLASGVHNLFIADLPEPGGLLPVAIIVVISLGELVCGAALVVGLLTRLASVLLALLMLANVLIIHPPHAFSNRTPETSTPCSVWLLLLRWRWPDLARSRWTMFLLNEEDRISVIKMPYRA